MNVDHTVRWQLRQHAVEKDVHIGAGHEHVARINGEDIPRTQVCKRGRTRRLNSGADPVHRQPGKVGAGRRINRREPAGQTAVGNGPGEKPG